MRNGYVLDWIAEAAALLRQVYNDDDVRAVMHDDIWRARVGNLLKPITVEAPKDNNNG